MIELSHIEKTYNGPDGPVPALKGIDLTVENGEIYGIIGLSGAGKSTLIRCINLLERPTRGQVVVDGKDLTAMNARELRAARQNIGMIFQHFNLLTSATVYDNIAFPLRLANTPEEKIRAKVEPLLTLVGLSDKAHQYPSQLSGGQKQRVGIARALANAPKILLSDEATSALDTITERSIQKSFDELSKDRTCLIIAHRLATVQNADRIILVDDGQIAEEGTHAELMKLDGRYAKLFNTQRLDYSSDEVN